MSVGRFLVLEGLDGAGTTTQTGRLCAALEDAGRRVQRTCEPTDRAVGRLIRAVLREDPEAPGRSSLPYLFAADRSDHLAQRILPALEQDIDVISDRYMPSSLAYQSLELPMARVASLNEDFRAPDLLIFLRTPVRTCLERIAARAGQAGAPPPEIYERAQALELIEARYDQALGLLRARGDSILEIDGDRPEREVFEDLWAAVEAL